MITTVNISLLFYEIIIKNIFLFFTLLGCGPFNVSKHLIDQSEKRILQIDQLKNALKNL